MSISATIRKHRTLQKKSQQDMSDFLGVDRNTYAKWENGTSEIKSSYIPKIADYLGVNIQDLFDQKKELINVIQKNKSCNNSLNAAVLVLTDVEMIEKVLEVIKVNLKSDT